MKYGRHMRARRRPAGALMRLQACGAAIVTLTLVCIMSVLPRAAFADGYEQADANTIRAATVELTATVLEPNGSQTKKTFKNDELKNTVPNVVPNTDLEFFLDVHLKDNAVVASNVKHLSWEYAVPVPPSVVANQFDEPQIVTEGGQEVATITLVKKDDGTCALRVEYNEEYAQDKDHDYFFSYNLRVNYRDEALEEGDDRGWEFPGTGVTIKVDHTPWKVTGDKNCAWVGRSETDLTCTVKLEAEGDVDNFRFWDVAGSDLNMDRDSVQVKYLYNAKNEDEAKEAALQLQGKINPIPDSDTGESAGMTLPKGAYEITYKASITNGAQADANDGDKYQSAKNTAHWKWQDGEGESSYVPSKRNWNYNWVSKNGWVEDSSKWYAEGSEQKREIKWTVDVNNGGDRADINGCQLTDTVQDGHEIDPDTVTIRAWDENNQEIDPAGVQIVVNDDRKGFSIDFSSGDPNYNKYQIEYKTVPTDSDEHPVSKYSNKAEVCGLTECKTATKDVDRPSKPNPDPDPDPGPEPDPEPPLNLDLIEKSVGSATKIRNTNVYSVPWTIEYTPPAEGNVTELHLYEDWVNGVSDGNTQHMWYSKDYLDLKVSVYNIKNDANCSEGNPNCWTEIPSDELFVSAADKKKGQSGKGYPNEYYDVRESYYDDEYHRGQGRELPGGTDFPEGYFRGEADRNADDTYALHDGAPAFTFSYLHKQIKDAEGNEILNLDSPNPFSHKMRITYNTLCDGTPDVYINYAKFHYRVNDKIADEVESATIPFVGDVIGGKTVDAENDGETWWNNQANCDEGDDGYCHVHWRVWGNGKKSWWSVRYLYDDDGNVKFYEELPGVSGVYELPESITMTDTLPEGWELDTDKPIFGRFVSMGDYATEDELEAAGLDLDLKGWLPIAEGDKRGALPQQTATFDFSGDGKSCDSDVACATYTVQAGKVVFTVPNDGSLTAWKTERVGDASPDSTTDGGPNRYDRPSTPLGPPIAKQGHSIIVYEFDTKISKVELRKQGMIDGSRFTYTNNANVQIGEHSSDVTGDVFVQQGEAPNLNKWVDGTGNNQVKYVVEINLTQQSQLPEGTVLTLTDTLHSSNAAYVQSSFRLSTNSGSWDEVTYPEGKDHFEVSFGHAAGSNLPTATIKLPIDGMRSNSMDQNSGQPLYKQKPLRLNYTVQLRGIPGQDIDLRNTVSFRGQLDGSASTNRTVQITKTDADAGASGSVTLKKVVDGDSSQKLSGATFKVCPVNLNAAPSKEWTADRRTECSEDPRTGVTDSLGRLVFHHGDGTDVESELYQFNENQLYVAWETQAPSGYAVNTTPQFFYVKNGRASDFDTKTRAMAAYADQHNLYVWDSGFQVADGLTSFMFGKVGADKVTQGTYKDPNDPTAEELPTYVATDESYLAASEWTLAKKDGSAEMAIVDGGDERSENGVIKQLKDHDTRDGRIEVRGVPAGEYTLVETKAPTGYVAEAQKRYALTIGADGKVTWSGDATPHAVTDGKGMPTGEWVIGNEKEEEPGVELPSAGSFGTHFAAFGFAFIAAAMCLAVIAQKNRKPGAHAATRSR